MGSKTSLYLSDVQKARWKASGASLGEIVDRGLDSAPAHERLIEAAVAAAVGAALDAVVDALREIASQAAREAQDGVYEALPEYVDRAVRSAIADMHGGGYA